MNTHSYSTWQSPARASPLTWGGSSLENSSHSTRPRVVNALSSWNGQAHIVLGSRMPHPPPLLAWPGSHTASHLCPKQTQHLPSRPCSTHVQSVNHQGHGFYRLSLWSAPSRHRCPYRPYTGHHLPSAYTTVATSQMWESRPSSLDSLQTS